jgi:hypothetical protein
MQKRSHRHTVSYDQFQSNMHELTANNTSAHQLADCIGVADTEVTLFFKMCEEIVLSQMFWLRVEHG